MNTPLTGKAAAESVREETAAQLTDVARAEWLEKQAARNRLPTPASARLHPVRAGFADPLEPVLERLGPSYKATVGPLVLIFREVRTDRELAADVSVQLDGRHLFRTTTTLSLTMRDRLAKTAGELAGATTTGDLAGLRQAVFAAVESVLVAEEQLGVAVDLRTASLELPSGGTHVATPLWTAGSTYIGAPGDAGKSTLMRAVAVSVAAGVTVIPGIDPVAPARPVLYVAGEDPSIHWHARSVEAVCRGLGIDRRHLAQPIELFDARGRPLHRIARAVAERAADFGAVILDSQQALLPQVDPNGGIRDRDSLFWHAVDQIGRPVAIIAHPNRSDARDWARATDGRMAGSEVNRDRARMAWTVNWQDERAVVGTSYRVYTLHNTKNNHGPKQPALSFAAAWEFGMPAGDPGVLRFVATRPVAQEPERLSPQLQEALDAYQAGAQSPTPLAKALGIAVETAKSRLRLLKEKGRIATVASEDQGEPSQSGHGPMPDA